MRFNWRECGRQFVARFGNLSVSVRRTGSRAKGTLRWHVGDVFGHPHLGKGGPYVSVESAIAEVEKIAIREATALARLVTPTEDRHDD